MITVQELKTKEDFKNLKPGDKIVLKYIKKGKMYFLEITRVEGEQLIGKPDTNYLQETFIDIPALIDRDLNKYIEYVIKLN